MQPGFHRRRLAGFADTMVDYAARAHAGWRDGATLDVADEMMRMTLGIAATTMFGGEVSQAEATRVKSTHIAGRGIRIHAGAVDIIGDIHGCFDELQTLLGALGWRRASSGRWEGTSGRALLLLGDVVNRGPQPWAVLECVESLVATGGAWMLLGNHDALLRDALRGVCAGHSSDPEVRRVTGLNDTLAALARASDAHGRARRALACVEAAPLWAEFTGGAAGVVAVHAAWPSAPDTLDPRRLEQHCVYGPTFKVEGERRPRRLDWRPAYPLDAPRCVHGHTAYVGPVRVVHNTQCLDTGAVFGGALTALRWPEDTLVQIPSSRAYSAHVNIPDRPPLFDSP
jgi:hypothetical protein